MDPAEVLPPRPTSCAGEPFCPHYRHAVELLGRRWTGAILRTMLRGGSRFGEIRRSVPELSDKMLAERLRELEKESIVTRRVIPDMPVRIVYELTPKGRELERAVEVIEAWADRWDSAASGRDPQA